jgi:hypothetical protein
MSGDPLHDYQEWLKRDQRRRAIEAAVLWIVLLLGGIGLGMLTIVIIGAIFGIAG